MDTNSLVSSLPLSLSLSPSPSPSLPLPISLHGYSQDTARRCSEGWKGLAWAQWWPRGVHSRRDPPLALVSGGLEGSDNPPETEEGSLLHSVVVVAIYAQSRDACMTTPSLIAQLQLNMRPHECSILL